MVSNKRPQMALLAEKLSKMSVLFISELSVFHLEEFKHDYILIYSAS